MGKLRHWPSSQMGELIVLGENKLRSKCMKRLWHQTKYFWSHRREAENMEKDVKRETAGEVK